MMNPSTVDDLDLDFSMLDAPASQPGRLIRAGETRWVVKRLTKRGLVTVHRGRTEEQARHVARRGDVVEEVGL